VERGESPSLLAEGLGESESTRLRQEEEDGERGGEDEDVAQEVDGERAQGQARPAHQEVDVGEIRLGGGAIVNVASLNGGAAGRGRGPRDGLRHQERPGEVGVEDTAPTIGIQGKRVDSGATSHTWRERLSVPS